MATTDIPDRQEIVEVMRAAIPPRWSLKSLRIGSLEADDGFEIIVGCPGSNDIGFLFRRASEYTPNGFKSRLLANPDIKAMRDAPDPIRNPELCFRLRVKAEGEGWSQTVVDQVLDLLYGSGHLTMEEAIWLRDLCREGWRPNATEVSATTPCPSETNGGVQDS